MNLKQKRSKGRSLMLVIALAVAGFIFGGIYIAIKL